MKNRPRNRSSWPKLSIHGKFCSTRSTDSSLWHPIDSARVWSMVIDLIDFVHSS